MSEEFAVNQYVFYPAHGVGKIIGIESQEAAGTISEMLSINFTKDEMTLRIPTAKAAALGIRGLPESVPVDEAADVDAAPPLVPAARAQPEILAELLQYGFSEDELYMLVIPKRTLARRRASLEPLTVEETDKALRLRRIAKHATRVFGDSAKAHRWLRKPKRILNGETPAAFLASEEGARIVEEMLRRIDYGMAA
jgi:putative toxin-antitoxin system antitoxin component (TIGR02293 family)